MLHARLPGSSGPPQAGLGVVGVVAIDGPAGSGKSTAASGLGAALGLPVLSTGLYFRLAALRANERHAPLAAIAEELASATIRLEGEVLICGETRYGEELRAPEVAAVVSEVAADPAVRACVLELERREIGRHRGIVVEGRDIGSVVWPEAEWKFFVTARRSVRAERRPEEARTIAARDARDASRAVAPLAIARGAFLVDTSDLAPREVVTRMARIVLATQ